MLTANISQNGSSRRLFTRAVGHDLPVASRTLPNSIERLGTPTSFARNAEIYRENAPADRLYKVVSGTVRTCRLLVDGRRQIGAFYLPGETFGLESGSEHAFSAEAVIETAILIINRNVAVSRAGWDSEVACELWDIMAGELARAQRHVSLLVQTAQERMAGFLLEMAERIQTNDEVELPMSRQDIADYLGVTIETVSRTLTQLANASAIALPTSKRVVLRKRTVLERLSA
jgi:CRP/FNR family transcriptional regulator, nitrogen fixation regulation protein